MKIAMFTDTFTPRIDGIITSLIGLSKKLALKGHKVFIIAPAFKGVSDNYGENIIVKRLLSMPAFFYEDYRLGSIFNIEVFNTLRKEKIDIIHFHTPLTLGLQAIIIAELLRIPLVGTFHTFFTDPQYLKNAKMDYPTIERITWAYARIFHNRCDLVTCPTESARKELIQHGFKRPIIVISNGIDQNVFDNSKQNIIRKKYSRGGKLLLFVGRIAHEKNISYLIDCFKKVLKKLPNTRLIIVGDGPQRAKLKEDVENIKSNVVLLGRIEHDKLIKSSIFGACDLFVTASTTETQGITMLEAQANGLVCVGLDAKGTKDLIKDGYNGYLAKNKEEFADKIIKLLTNNKLYTIMKKNTLKEIKKHDQNKITDRWIKIYWKLSR